MINQLIHNVLIKHIYIVLIALYTLSSCRTNENTEAIKEQENTNSDLVTISRDQFDLANMELGTMAEINFPTFIRSNGIIDVPPEGKATVTTFYAGYVKSISLLPGDRIENGEPVLTLENPAYIEMQEEYLEAKSRLEYLKTDYERQKTLNSEQISSQKNYMKSETDYKVTLTKYESLKKKLRMVNINPSTLSASNLTSVITLYAPISGYITEVSANKGMFLSAGKEAIEIVNTTHIHLELNVFEKDVQKVKEGQLIKFRLPNNETTSYDADVHLVGKKVSSGNRIVEIHGHLKDETKHMFLPGMYVEARIEIDSKSAFVLPEQAVVHIGNANYVLVLVNKTDKEFQFIKTKVQTGRTENSNVEIFLSDEIKNTDKVLVKGAFDMIY